MFNTIVQLSLWCLMGAAVLGYLGFFLQILSVGFVVAGFCVLVLSV